MKRCPTCIRVMPDDAMVLCPFDGTPLFDTITKFDPQADTIETGVISEEDKRASQDNKPPSKIEAVPASNSIVEPIVNAESNKIPLLLLIWIQLIIANYLWFAIIGSFRGAILGFYCLILLLPLSIITSRLVNRNKILSIIVGGLIAAMIEGGIELLVFKGEARYGIMYGAFFGASLTYYFSKDYKYTNVFWASISTLFLIAIIVIPEFAEYGVIFILELFRDYIGHSVQGAVMTILIGLPIFLLIRLLQRVIEYTIDKVVDALEV